MTKTHIYVGIWTTVSFCILESCFVHAAPNAGDVPQFDKKQIKFFEDEVRPILRSKCFKCHGGEAKIKGGLRLTTRDGLLKGGESGSVVALDDPSSSLLLEAINYESLEMPPTGKLPQRHIDILTRWVEMSLPWTPGDDGPEVAEENQLEPPINEKTKSFWSFQRVVRPDAPKTSDQQWVKNPIDAFILAKLEEAELKPSPRADDVELLRRAYYDLTGLPPCPEEVDAYLESATKDPRAAFEDVVDRLLDSPNYGEKWGRHWLDLVRYAETNSYERDGAKPFVWRYRDYVIQSFNDDKPYDQFVREQLAGDELDEVTPDSIIATGYYRLGIWQDEPVDVEQELFEDLDDIVRTTGEVYLGLTMGCARCHYHKLDPIPQEDYYGMVAFFRNIRRFGARSNDSVLDASVQEIDAPADKKEFAKQIAEHNRKIENVEKELKRLEALVTDKFTGVEKEDFQFEVNRVAIMKRYIKNGINEAQVRKYEDLTRRRNEFRDNQPKGKAKALCIKEHGRTVPATHLLMRGNAHAPGDQVEPRFPTVLGFPRPEIAELPTSYQTSGRRRVLAQWIASPDNPLTARVMVNRIWQYHFGRGIVRSSSDFGFQGTAPTHPELLDWLASEFVDGGWKLKQLHKLIMMSNTYQISSRGNQAGLDKDPENDLFWRFNMHRLTAEEIRDSILAVNGSLNHKMFGPSIYPHIPNEVKQGQSRPGAGWGNSSPEEQARRSIYIHIKRSLVVPMMAAFDVADTDATCPVRFVTTQPTQALGMMNGRFLNDQAKVFADYLRKNAGNNPNDQVELALSRAVQRNPTKDEIAQGVSLLRLLAEKYQVDANRALDYYCLVVLNLNEFMYLD